MSLGAAPASAVKSVGRPAWLAAAGGDTQVTLSWPVTRSRRDVTYTVYQKQDRRWRRIATVAAPSTTHVVAGLINGVAYSFTVTAKLRGRSESRRSPVASATPTAPPFVHLQSTPSPPSPPSPTPTPRPTPTPTATSSPSPTPTATVPPGPARRCGTLAEDTEWAGPNVLTCMVSVPAGVTLTIEPGAVVAAQPGFGFEVAGQLLVNATVYDPVTLTSTRDQLTSFGDGEPPGPGSWSGVLVQGSTAVVHLDGVRLRYGDKCVRVVETGPDVRISGEVSSCAYGVVSYDPFVRATDVDWGSPTGPAPFGSGASITGLQVAAIPWRGFVAPDMPTDVTPQPPPDNLSCVDVVMYGIRGSGEKPQPAGGSGEETFSGDTDGLGTVPFWSLYYLTQSLSNGRPGTTSKQVALQYPAPTFAGRTVAETFRLALGGVPLLRQVIDDELARCPDTQVSAVGMSMGALVLRLYLSGLAGPVPADHIAAVAMVGDPIRPARPTELTWSNANTAAPASVTATPGTWAGLFGPGQIPATVSDRAISLCNATDSIDLICAPIPGSTVTGHTQYPPMTPELGAWLGARVLERLP